MVPGAERASVRQRVEHAPRLGASIALTLAWGRRLLGRVVVPDRRPLQDNAVDLEPVAGLRVAVALPGARQADAEDRPLAAGDLLRGPRDERRASSLAARCAMHAAPSGR